MNAAACPRVVVAVAENRGNAPPCVVLPALFAARVVMPVSADQVMAFAAKFDGVTSANGGILALGSGRDAMRHKNVANSAQDIRRPGSKVVCEVPVVNPSENSHRAAWK